MTSDSCDLSLIIACYNEAPHLVRNIEQIFATLDCMRLRYEIIFVEDCSKDSTRDVITTILNANPQRPLRAIFHEKNTGRGRAVADGIEVANGDFVGYIDVDLEVQAHFILPCLLKLQEGCDVVTGVRIYRSELKLIHREILSRCYRWLGQRLLALKCRDSESGFKFFRRSQILPVLPKIQATGWFWDTEIIKLAELAGLRMSEVSVLFIRDSTKQSTVRLVPDTINYIKQLLAFRGRLR